MGDDECLLGVDSVEGYSYVRGFGLRMFWVWVQ